MLSRDFGQDIYKSILYTPTDELKMLLKYMYELSFRNLALKRYGIM